MTNSNANISASLRNSRVLVVGATSSLAQSICRSLAARGCTLILNGRDTEELQLLAGDLVARYQITCSLQVADLAAESFSAADCIAQAGEFDHVIIAVGDMGNGNNEDLANISVVTRVNYTVPAQIALAAAVRLRGMRPGVIAIISSVAGDRGRQGNIAYGSAKAALNAFASGLRGAMLPSGVHVLTIKPGFVDTPMTWGMQSPLIAARDYVAEKIVHAMEKKTDVLYVPWFWRFIMLIICSIPEAIFKKLKI